MPRDQHRDDFDDMPAKKSGSKTGLIIALVVGGVLLVLCLPVAGFAVYWMARTGPPAPANNSAADTAPEMGKAPVAKDWGAKDGVDKGGGTRRVWSREDFKAAVMGKSMDEVMMVMGKPDRTSKIGDVTWFYDKVMTDPAGKMDFRAAITFKDGKVVTVSY